MAQQRVDNDEIYPGIDVISTDRRENWIRLAGSGLFLLAKRRVDLLLDVAEVLADRHDDHEAGAETTRSSAKP